MVLAMATVKGNRSGQILLVEDQEIVRNLMRIMLVREGYDVVVAAEGAEALELSRGQRFDLVITDMVMPKMTGKALAASLHAERPGLPVIFVSGFMPEGTGEVQPGDTFLQKPFSAADLSFAVRTSLHRRDS